MGLKGTHNVKYIFCLHVCSHIIFFSDIIIVRAGFPLFHYIAFGFLARWISALWVFIYKQSLCTETYINHGNALYSRQIHCCIVQTNKIIFPRKVWYIFRGLIKYSFMIVWVQIMFSYVSYPFVCLGILFIYEYYVECLHLKPFQPQHV